ncbi:MAG: alpha/beta hydrolase family protein [Corynebacterium sp.]|nr:alpha/beta hydrolase family protein [Corynebacterium sp.]
MHRRRTIRHYCQAILSILLAVLLIGTNLAPAHADQDNRSWLRPGCDWSPHGQGMQICYVPSASNGRAMGVVILPAKYGGDGGLYMLGGIGSTETDSQWANTSAPALFQNDNVTLVMPTGGEGQFYADWMYPGTPITNNDFQLLPPPKQIKWETFLTQELPAWLQQNFGVNPHRNSIVGISMGAISTLTLAERHPDQFRQTFAMSGFLDPAMFGHLVMLTMLSLVTPLFGGGLIFQMWGFNPFVLWNNMMHLDPMSDLNGLRNVDTIIWVGDGRLPPGHVMPPGLAFIPAFLGEWLINLSTRSFVFKAGLAGVPLTFLTGPGIHAWPTWELRLAEQRGRILSVVG